jgi:hypothetical protein
MATALVGEGRDVAVTRARKLIDIYAEAELLRQARAA